MLKKISIKNLGLVENEEITFSSGFTVITGETGAGKSFFCNAIKLGIGERAKNFFDGRTVIDLDLNEYNFRRILENKKSRFFINDIPESLKEGIKISSEIFHMHSQHDNMFLKKPEAATALFDSALENKEVKNIFQKTFIKYKEEKKKLEILQEEIKEKNIQKEFWEFQLQRMEKINFSLETFEKAKLFMKKSQISLEKSQEISYCINLLAGEGESILSQIDTAEEYIKNIDENIRKKMQPLFSIIPELIDDLEKLLPKNDEKRDEYKQLIHQVETWIQEENVADAQKLFEKKEKLEKNIELLAEYEQKVLEQEYSVEILKDKVLGFAKNLSDERKKIQKKFSEQIEEKCKKMGMEKAQFKVAFSETDLCKYGNEQVQFLFSANQEQTLHNISEIASGGEIARITLALKQFFPHGTTLIFDEIDTGVSGSIAEKMAKEMKKLSEKRQIISITHLPQIAAMADHHLIVEKTHHENKTVTQLRYVTGDEKIETIAKMISGEIVSEEALQTAKKLCL